MVNGLIVIALLLALAGAWALFSGDSRRPPMRDKYDHIDRNGPSTPGI